MTLFEACTEGYEQSKRAEELGAHRIELCGDLSVAGITPPREVIEKCKQNLKLDIATMVRPRGGDFV